MDSTTRILSITAVGLLLINIALGTMLWHQLASSTPDTENASSLAMNTSTPQQEGETSIPRSELPQAPELQVTEPKGTQPLHLFLFTHTEDPFNHEQYEERYRRTGELLEKLQEDYPDEDITWTLQFQGTDANAIQERNTATGLATYLQQLQRNGLVEFGYHGHHDATYQNRPQNDLTNSSSWTEVYDALDSWITCKKDVLYGGCISEKDGGILAIQEIFGPVKVVSGLGVSDGTLIERSAGSEAVQNILPDRWLGFGFPDHGSAINDDEYEGLRNSLLTLLSPTYETSSAVFWMDNALRINDGVPVDNAKSFNLSNGPNFVQEQLAAIDRNRPNVVNTGIAIKYLYSSARTSPTKYGYANPENPQLPEELLLSTREKGKKYAFEEAGMRYLLDEFLPSNPESSFKSADQVVALYTSEDYWNVTEEELTQIAAWLIEHWNERPPAYTYDGEDFYSLSDSFALLAHELSESTSEGDLVSEWYGPWSGNSERMETTKIQSHDLQNLVTTIKGPEIQYQYQIKNSTLTAAQVLYAMAYEYLLQQTQTEGSWNTIKIPSTSSAPETLETLSALGCECYDTAWSLKPARWQD